MPEIIEETFQQKRKRIMKRRKNIRLAREELERRYKEYHGKTITCPVCSEQGRLRFQRDGDPRHRYFYCIHSSNPSMACYIGRIEDIEELLSSPLETRKQTTL